MSFFENEIRHGEWSRAAPPKITAGSDAVVLRFAPMGVGDAGGAWTQYWAAAAQLSLPLESWNEKGAVPQSVLKNVLADLENWSAFLAPTLTFPPTLGAWGDALEKTVRQVLLSHRTLESSDLSSVDPAVRQILALAAAFPSSFALCFNRIKPFWPELLKIAPIFSGLEGPRGLFWDALEPKEGMTLKGEGIDLSPPSSQEKEAIPEKVPQEKLVRVNSENNPKTDPLAPWIIKAIRSLREGDWEPAIKKEWLDDKIKWRINQAVPVKTPGQWFAQDLFPDLGRLPLADMITLKKFWPTHRQFALEDPESWLSSAKFWGILKNAFEDRRTYILKELLPLWISLETMDSRRRISLGKKMLEYAQKSPALFRERLSLWVDLGGDLLETPTGAGMTKPISLKEDHLFDGKGSYKPAENLAAWILLQKNPMWEEELSRLAIEWQIDLPGMTEFLPVITKTSPRC